MYCLRLFLFFAVSSLVSALPPKFAGSDVQKQYLVLDLPGLHTNVQEEDIPLMFSGQLQLYPENNTNYFFWSYKDQHPLPENTNRTMFWLNGGPGCSSLDGALLEAGPFRVNEDRKIVYNKGSWHKAANMVFVDQPGGTGFSYTDVYDSELYQVTQDFLVFMSKYYEIFPEERDNEIYFAGESYAGQYIPYIADGILRHNRNLTEGEKPYNLKGLLIGNGWISPNEQSLSYLPYAVQAGIVSTENERWGQILSDHEQCQKIVNRIDANFDGELHEYEVSSSTCERVLQTLLTITRDKSLPKDEQCFNMYDYTKKDSFPSCGMNWPHELVFVMPFLREDEVKGDLNIKNNQVWRECSGAVGSHLHARNSIPSVHLLPSILETVPIVLFNGNLDIICNYMGTESFIKKMTWGGSKGFSSQDTTDWIYDSKTAGYIKSERNLTFVNVFGASHMVPYDVPEISRALIDLITGNYDVQETQTKSDKTKKSYVTYPIGVRAAKLEADAKAKAEADAKTKAEADAKAKADAAKQGGQASPTEEEKVDGDKSNSDASTSESAIPEDYDKSATVSKITRVIQLLVIIVLIWGMYVLYTSCKSRPSSIIKTGPSTGKKKNVQWADQLRRFQEDDEEAQRQNQGFFSKTFGKFTTGDNRGNYTPAPDKYYEDIELGDGITEHDEQSGASLGSASVDNFVIDSEEEDELEEQEQVHTPPPATIQEHEVTTDAIDNESPK
ncbi:hypothetical protein G9P44_002501 [Scheffersomyces stipitis]|nr:hypothetical protein G9P44_002501 [Scheffersomyces stipitis]